jgi:hypothetical protein
VTHDGIPRALFNRIDELLRLRQSPAAFEVYEGSVLAADDVASTPYEVSHGVHRHLDTAIDHLLAIKLLAVDAGVLPTYGAFTLLRAAVENFASAMWLLRGEDCRERVLRELRFQHANLNALAQSDKLVAQAVQQTGRATATAQDRMDRVRRVAGRNGLTMKEVKAKPDWRQIVKALGVDEATEATAEYLWKACSAFAHGDPWPSIAFLDREELPGSDQKVAQLRLTVSFANLTPMLELAVSMAGLVLRAFDARRLPVPPAA